LIDYYEILDVSETANEAEIKIAFKAKARDFHPDRHKGNKEMEERFKEINLAYQVLKNPYERARYDLKRKFGEQQFSSDSIHNPPRYYPPPNFRRRAYKVNYRENWIATAYAFGFSLIVAILVMIGIELKRNYDEKRYAEILEKRRSTFEKAIENEKNGEIREAISLMNSLGGFLSEEDEMEEFRKKLIDESFEKGNESFETGQYQEAIYYYKIIDDLTRIPPLSIKENLSISYKKTGQINESIAVLNELLNEGYRNLFIYTELARIYRDNLKNQERAILYFENAQDLMVEYYEAIYGRAYPVTMSGRSVPEYHKNIYYELLELYVVSGNKEQVLATAKWIKRLWSNEYQSSITLAEAYKYCGKKDKSCEEYYLAKELNPSLELVNNYCGF